MLYDLVYVHAHAHARKHTSTHKDALTYTNGGLDSGFTSMHFSPLQTVHYADDGDSCCRGIAEFMSEDFMALRHPKLARGDLSGTIQVR